MPVNDKRAFDKDGKAAEVEPEPEPNLAPVLALHDAPADPVEQKVDELIQEHEERHVDISAGDILAAAGAEGLLDSMVLAVADMLNRFAEVDHDWMLELVSANIDASEKIVQAATDGELPFRLTPDGEGKHITSLVGLFNALLAHVGCRGHVEIAVGVDTKTRKPVHLQGFEPVFPDEEEPG